MNARDLRGSPDSQPATVARVNRAIREAGGAEKLTRGRGYYYFREGTTGTWRATSVYIYRVDGYTMSQWMDEYRSLRADSWLAVTDTRLPLRAR